MSSRWSSRNGICRGGAEPPGSTSVYRSGVPQSGRTGRRRTAALLARRGLQALLVVALGACGSTDGASDTQPGTNCDGLCVSITSADCGPGALAKCLTDCERSFGASLTTCPSETSKLLACEAAAGPRACDMGPGMLTGECEPLTYPQAGCMACEPAPEDSLCIGCLKRSCCGAWRATRADPHFFDFEVCDGPCGYACSEGCGQQYPQEMAEMNALDECTAKFCERACP